MGRHLLNPECRDLHAQNFDEKILSGVELKEFFCLGLLSKYFMLPFRLSKKFYHLLVMIKLYLSERKFHAESDLETLMDVALELPKLQLI